MAGSHGRGWISTAYARSPPGPPSGSSPRRSRLAQRYVSNLLLTPDGRKFDLRVYWIVASFTPELVLYYDGTLRVSAGNFSTDSDGKGVHLTNAAQQEGGHSSHDESTRRPMAYLWDALESHRRPGWPKDPAAHVDCEIRRAIQAVWRAYEPARGARDRRRLQPLETHDASLPARDDMVVGRGGEPPAAAVALLESPRPRRRRFSRALDRGGVATASLRPAVSRALLASPWLRRLRDRFLGALSRGGSRPRALDRKTAMPRPPLGRSRPRRPPPGSPRPRRPRDRPLSSRTRRYILLGADFMIDTDLNLRLSEIQSGCGLPTNTKAVREVVERMIPDVADVVLAVKTAPFDESPPHAAAIALARSRGMEVLANGGVTPEPEACLRAGAAA